MRALKLTGQRFGQLVVIRRCPSSGYRVKWECLCDCGKTTSVVASALQTGRTKSCGCLRGKRSKHGHAKRNAHTRTYGIWRSLFKRCYKPNSAYFYRYGARGIEVDPRWATFEGFYADMGDCPEGHTLERLHNDRNYWKGNCIWATQRAQMRNTSKNRVLTWQGQTKCIAEWAEMYNITQSLLWQRLYRLGWSLERALTTPPRPIRSGRNRNHHGD
jgi:hypothetical protein